MASKISELLSDPDGISKLKSVAETLFADKRINGDEPEPPQKSDDDGGGGFKLPEGFDPSKIMGLLSVMNSRKADSRTELLMALRPHLSEERQQKVDKAVKLLKIAAFIPILKDRGLLDLF